MAARRLALVALGIAASQALRLAPRGSRRDAVAQAWGLGLGLGLAPVTVQALEPGASNAGAVPTRVAGQYYFPTARYRYLPRIFQAWGMLTVDAPTALAKEPVDWASMDDVVKRADDITTALPLFADAIEGARSSKRKAKSGLTKDLLNRSAEYKTEFVKLEKAVKKRDAKATTTAIASTSDVLLKYRVSAAIDAPDGGMVDVPENMKRYIPVFRGMPTEAMNRNARAVKERAMAAGTQANAELQ